MKCPHCNGVGFRNDSNYFGSKRIVTRKECLECDGTGKIEAGGCWKKQRIVDRKEE